MSYDNVQSLSFHFYYLNLEIRRGLGLSYSFIYTRQPGRQRRVTVPRASRAP
jgi:hypothetical protein